MLKVFTNNNLLRSDMHRFLLEEKRYKDALGMLAEVAFFEIGQEVSRDIVGKCISFRIPFSNHYAIRTLLEYISEYKDKYGISDVEIKEIMLNRMNKTANVTFPFHLHNPSECMDIIKYAAEEDDESIRHLSKKAQERFSKNYPSVEVLNKEKGGGFMKYKKNKSGYYRETFNTDEILPSGKKRRIEIRDKDINVFKAKLNEAKRLYSKGVDMGNTTVQDWAVRWIAVYKAYATETQQAHYKAKVDIDILPAIGTMQMRDVRSSHLQVLLNSYTGGRAGTVTKIKLALKQFFEEAMIEGVIERNPAARLIMPKVTEKKRRSLTDFEMAIIYQVAQTHKHGAYVLTMLFCGLRVGECVALTVGDVDLESKRITISKAMEFRKNIGKEKATKSDAGMRQVPIPDILLPTLIKCCDKRKPSAPLFPKMDGKRATLSACKRWWESFLRHSHIMAGAKLYRNEVQIDTSSFDDDITPHYLRHTYGSTMLAAKIDLTVRKAFLGHSSNDVTDRYTKINNDAFEHAAELLNAYLSTLCFNL